MGCVDSLNHIVHINENYSFSISSSRWSQKYSFIPRLILVISYLVLLKYQSNRFSLKLFFKAIYVYLSMLTVTELLSKGC